MVLSALLSCFESVRQAVWITALLPYFVLIPLLIRGVFLEGAWFGIKYYLYPEWIKLWDPNVWVEAAKQIYFSLGPGFGTLMALSSYNKFNHNCRRSVINQWVCGCVGVKLANNLIQILKTKPTITISKIPVRIYTLG